MQFQPSLDEFREISSDYDVISVRSEFTSDAETPLSAYVKLSASKPAFLFESVVGGEQVSRFSFVGVSPTKTISCGQSETVVTQRGESARRIPTPPDPLKLVEDEIQGIRYFGTSPDARFSGGAVGYIAYEYANRVEPTVPLPKEDELGMPLLFFMIADLVLIFDHACQTLTICANAYVDDRTDDAYRDACSRIEDTFKLLEVLNKFSGQLLQVAVISVAVCPGLARVEQAGVYARHGYRHLQV